MRTIQRINKTRSWFFEKINKIDKSLPRLTKGHRDSISNKIRNEKGDIKTETEEIQKNHKILLQKPVLNTIGESGGNGQFLRQIPITKIKSESNRSSKQTHNTQRNRRGHRKPSDQKKHRTRWF